MYKLYILLLAAFATITLSAPESRIIGGSEVDIAKHPYLVSIRYRSKSNPDDSYWHKCGGSIYSERVVITAAQCIVDIAEDDRVVIVAGANTRIGSDGMMYPVKKWVSHPDYTFWTMDYDIGIMIVDEPFNFKAFQMNAISIRAQRPTANKLAIVAGWGYQEEFGPSSYNLEDTQVPIVSTDECKKAYDTSSITERMICAGYLLAGGKDACQGDTGGPLIYEQELVGLVSWGRGCARPGFPSVYTFVSSLQKWIDDTIAENV